MTLRALHVLESLAPGGMETTFLHVLQSWRGRHEDAVHHVLAFAGGALDPAYRRASDALFITPDTAEVERIAAEPYDVIHLLFERCANRLLPWLTGHQQAALVYGKGYDLAGMSRLNEGLYWQADASALWGVDAATFTTRALAEGYERPPDCTVLGKAASIQRFLDVPLPSASTPSRIVSVANLHPRKRLADFVPVLSRVRRTVADACVRLVGAGQPSEVQRIAEGATAAGVSDAIEVAGFHEDVLPDLACSRVFALPSACEGVSTAMLEAMAAGRPVVVTRVGHMSEAIDDGVEGFLVAPGDTDGFARCLERLLTDQALAARMGEAGRRRAREHDVVTIGSALHRVLERTASRVGENRNAKPGDAAGRTTNGERAGGEAGRPPDPRVPATSLVSMFEAIGSDRVLSPDDLPDAGIGRQGEDGQGGGLTGELWAAYERHWRRFCGARLDPMFWRLAHPARWTGAVQLPAGAAVVVVGTGPSLDHHVDRLKGNRDAVYLFTSPRGAEALAGRGLVPDLVIVEHQSALDAHLSARHVADRNGHNVLCDVPLVCAAPNTPAALVRTIAPDRVFVPSPWPTWGAWPATAVALALAGGASQVQLLGVDLGTPGQPDPARAPLAELLSVLARHARSCDCSDAGELGSVKDCWPKRALQAGGNRHRPAITVARQPWAPIEERVAEARRSAARLAPCVEQAREGLAAAIAVRDGSRAPGSLGALHSSLRTILAWGHVPAVRLDLQEALGVNFLPRLWRIGVDSDLGPRAWRPVALATHEVIRQSESLAAALLHGEV